MLLEKQRLPMLLDTVSGMTGGLGINRHIFREFTTNAGKRFKLVVKLLFFAFKI